MSAIAPAATSVISFVCQKFAGAVLRTARTGAGERIMELPRIDA